jgi:hypothetical protein
MRPAKILEHLRAAPFLPLRIFLSDGSYHDVPHPEFAFVSVHKLEIVKDIDPEGVPHHTVTCDPVHVTRIEPQPHSDRTSRRE